MTSVTNVRLYAFVASFCAGNAFSNGFIRPGVKLRNHPKICVKIPASIKFQSGFYTYAKRAFP